MRGTQPGDRVYHQQGLVTVRPHDFRNPLDVMPGPGGAFGRLHKHCAHLMVQPRPDVIQRKRLAIGDFEYLHVAAECLGKPRPALAELPRGQHKHLVAGRGQVRDRRLHHACAGTSQHQHVVLGADDFLHVGQHALKQRAEVGRPMMRRERSHGRLRRRQQRRWPGSKKTILMQHRQSPYE